MKMIVSPALAALLAAASASAVAAQDKGFITGELSYPSDFIPPDLTVCAIDLATRQEHCTSRKTRSGRRYTYRLEVPAGNYHVFARTKEMSGVRAFYNEFVTCGLDASCKSHKPIAVSVKAGATAGKINPQDWYDR